MDYYCPSANVTSSFTTDGSSSSVKNSIRNSSKLEKKKKSTRGKKTKGTSTHVVKLSTDPQSVAARERRHRISYRFKILQSMIPGGSKMDTVSMLDEAIHYVKFLKTQISLHQAMIMSFADDQDSSSSLCIPNSFPVQGNIYPSNTTEAVQPSQLLPLPDSCFQILGDQPTMPYEVYMRNVQ